jgi:hypothetical protein
MKFDYCREASLPGSGYSSSFPYTYHFQFSLSSNEIEKVLHKYGVARNISIIDALECKSNNDPHKILWSLALIQDTFTDDGKVNLDFNYKKKYEELVELLKPHKLEDDMSPSTTLKMILKYQVK